jgi:hypothetical protein
MLQALKSKMQALREAKAKAKMEARLDSERKRLDAILARAKAKIEMEAALARAKITYKVWKD